MRSGIAEDARNLSIRGHDAEADELQVYSIPVQSYILLPTFSPSILVIVQSMSTAGIINSAQNGYIIPGTFYFEV